MDQEATHWSGEFGWLPWSNCVRANLGDQCCRLNCLDVWSDRKGGSGCSRGQFRATAGKDARSPLRLGGLGEVYAMPIDEMRAVQDKGFEGWKNRCLRCRVCSWGGAQNWLEHWMNKTLACMISPVLALEVAAITEGQRRSRGSQDGHTTATKASNRRMIA